MNKAKIILLLTLASLASACSWVKLDSGGEAVRVAYDGNVSGCRDAGAVGVSVQSRVGFYHRSGLTVRDELELLARNEAASLHADTIKAIDEPKDGQQHFEAYVCGGVRVKQKDAAGTTQGAVETFPVKDH